MSTVTTRLVLLAVASTPALRSARFSDDEPLDDDGRQRAAELGPLIARHDHAVRSPAQAACETAALLGHPAMVEPGLGDWDLGRWKGKALAELGAAKAGDVAAWISDPDSAPHGGESLAGLLHRVRTWLNATAVGDRRVLAITHPAIIRGVAVVILDAPAAAFWKIDIGPLTQTVLHGTDGTWRLRAINQARDIDLR
jgi:broad specificity phosphatase PhoE